MERCLEKSWLPDELSAMNRASWDKGGADDIARLLDSCSENFDSTNNNLDDSRIPFTSEFPERMGDIIKSSRWEYMGRYLRERRTFFSRNSSGESHSTNSRLRVL